MPSDRRSSSHGYRASPYTRCNADRTDKSPSLPIGNKNEWEETRCCICMEHPHNAVLLVCSSREKGCLPYICDTSARHSNCLDQFRKTFMNDEGEQTEQTKLVCPLCRGKINKWIVVKPAREFMNSKTRSCSMGTCDFSGDYPQLRKHARREHPHVRPTDVDPERELEWTKLEQDLEQQDMLSMQFEFADDDYDDEAIAIMDGVYELASPNLDPEMNMLTFFSAFEAEFGSFFPELDLAVDNHNLFLEDWENELNLSSPPLPSHESEIEEYGRSRGRTSTHDTGMPRQNARATRSRTNARGRQRSNGPPSTHNPQEQVTTLVEFHELRSSMP